VVAKNISNIKMSWFGGSSRNNNDDSSSDRSGHTTTFDDTSGLGLSSSSTGGSSSSIGLNNVSEFQQVATMIQQQVVIQAVISELTDHAFHKCCMNGNHPHRDGTLSGREISCIYATSNKWLDSNEYLSRRLGRKLQQQQQQ
jgi:hypothetical protein